MGPRAHEVGARMRAGSILALCIGVLVSAQSFVHAAPNSAVVTGHASGAFVQPNFVSGARWGRRAMSLLRPRPAVTRLHILGGTRGLASSAMAGSVPGMLGFADAASPSPPVQAPEPKGVTGAVAAHYDDLYGRMMSASFGPADHSKAPALRVLDMAALEAAGEAGARARAELCNQLRERHFAVSAVSPPDISPPERPVVPAMPPRHVCRGWQHCAARSRVQHRAQVSRAPAQVVRLGAAESTAFSALWDVARRFFTLDPASKEAAAGPFRRLQQKVGVVGWQARRRAALAPRAPRAQRTAPCAALPRPAASGLPPPPAVCKVTFTPPRAGDARRQ